MKNPSTIFLVTYIILTFFCIMSADSVGENLVDTNGKVFMYGLLMTILEIPVIYYMVWKMILEKIADAISYDENQKALCSFYSKLALPIAFTFLNMIIIENLNQSLDKSKPTKRYLTVTRKYSKAMTRSSGDPRTDTHYIDITSWLSNKTFTTRITREEYNNYNVNDVIQATTNSGYFGFSYYTSLRKIDKSIFPDGTKFPLNEEQALKLIEEKNGKE